MQVFSAVSVMSKKKRRGSSLGVSQTFIKYAQMGGTTPTVVEALAPQKHASGENGESARRDSCASKSDPAAPKGVHELLDSTKSWGRGGAKGRASISIRRLSHSTSRSLQTKQRFGTGKWSKVKGQGRELRSPGSAPISVGSPAWQQVTPMTDRTQDVPPTSTHELSSRMSQLSEAAEAEEANGHIPMPVEDTEANSQAALLTAKDTETFCDNDSKAHGDPLATKKKPVKQNIGNAVASSTQRGVAVPQETKESPSSSRFADVVTRAQSGGPGIPAMQLDIWAFGCVRFFF